MNHWARRSAVWMCWGLCVTAGCYAYRQVSLPPAPESRVRVIFRSPLILRTTPIAADSVEQTYSGVLEVTGVVQAAAGDSLALRLEDLRTAAGSVAGVSGRVVMVPTGAIARVEERRFQAGATALTGIGVATLALTTFLVFTIAAIMRSF